MQNRIRRWSISAILCILSGIKVAQCCTNVLVTGGASVDGNPMIAYNADSPSLEGMLYHYPETKNNDENAMRKVYSWDTGAYLGEISEAKNTYNVVGNTNSEGLVIAETTFGGIETLFGQKNAKIDYGSLIYITLQRSKTARQAIKTMVNLMDTYGYASGGESFSLSDSTTGEVWMMEVIGRGDVYEGKRMGAVWVAVRIPDGHVAAHSNQARIQNFPRDDPDNCLYADDVVDLAVKLGLYKRGADGSDLDFSFSDVYDPVTFFGARHGDARTWAIFSHISADPTFADTYTDYITGQDLTHRMPLYIKPKKHLDLPTLTKIMSNHYQFSDLATYSDVGAGLQHSPHRPLPLNWQYQQNEYFNERPIAIPKTSWNFIAQIRTNMPAPLSTIVWFATDDSATAPRLPVYGSVTKIPQAYAGKGTQDGVPSAVFDFDLSKAFWIQNMVSNFAYSQWNKVYPILQKKLDRVLQKHMHEISIVDKHAMDIYRKSNARDAIQFVTEYTVEAGDQLHKTWFQFYGELFTRFRDGYEIVPDPKEESCHCTAKETGFDEDWKKRIVRETGDRYKAPKEDARNGVEVHLEHKPISKHLIV